MEVLFFPVSSVFFIRSSPISIEHACFSLILNKKPLNPFFPYPSSTLPSPVFLLPCIAKFLGRTFYIRCFSFRYSGTFRYSSVCRSLSPPIRAPIKLLSKSLLPPLLPSGSFSVPSVIAEQNVALLAAPLLRCSLLDSHEADLHWVPSVGATSAFALAASSFSPDL